MGSACKVDGSGSKLLHRNLTGMKAFSEKTHCQHCCTSNLIIGHSSLGLIIYTKKANLKSALKPISYKAIEAVHIICPESYQCVTSGCGFRSLVQITRQRDIPLVTLVKNNTIHENVPVLTGRCSNCTTLYSADHERSPEINEENKFTNLYLNSAKYNQSWSKYMGRSTFFKCCCECYVQLSCLSLSIHAILE